MGNVLASSLPPKEPAPDCSIIPSPVEELLDNPGSLEDLHKKCKGLLIFVFVLSLGNFMFF